MKVELTGPPRGNTRTDLGARLGFTVMPAWNMACKNRSVTNELVFSSHRSDRGIQYAYNEFKSLLDKNRLVIRSMSRKGNCCGGGPLG